MVLVASLHGQNAKKGEGMRWSESEKHAESLISQPTGNEKTKLGSGRSHRAAEERERRRVLYASMIVRKKKTFRLHIKRVIELLYIMLAPSSFVFTASSSSALRSAARGSSHRRLQRTTAGFFAWYQTAQIGSNSGSYCPYNTRRRRNKPAA